MIHKKVYQKFLPLSDICIYENHTLQEPFLNGKRNFILGFKCETKHQFSISEESESPIYSCKFNQSPSSNSLLALAFEDGKILLQDVSKINHENSFVLEKDAHKNAIFEISWISNQNEFLTAVADCTVCHWSLQSDLRPLQSFHGHTKAVKCVDVNPWDCNIFGSGGRDCNIVIWDTRCQHSLKSNEIIGAHSNTNKHLESPREGRGIQSQIQNSVISVVFNQQHQLISTGASDGLIKIWDLRRTYRRGKREPLSLHTLEYAGQSSFKGYTTACLSPAKDRLFVSCLDGNIYAYHLANPTLKPVERYFGHRANTYYSKMCVSPCGSYVLSGSSDDRAYIWLTDEPGCPVGYLNGHADEVTSVAWTQAGDGGTIVTCSDDLKHRVFSFKCLEESLTESDLDYCSFAVPFNKTEYLSQNKMNENESKGNSLISSYNSQMTNKNVQSPIINSDRDCFDNQNSPLIRTPSSSKSRSIPVTPRTSERKSLLAWLSSGKKTPRESNLLKTPTSETSKRKHSLKRKLTDLMEEQENIEDGSQCKSDTSPVKSPPKNVLSDLGNVSNNANTAAKMLIYDTHSPQPKTDLTKDDPSDVDCTDLMTLNLVNEGSFHRFTSVIQNNQNTPDKCPLTLNDMLSSPQNKEYNGEIASVVTASPIALKNSLEKDVISSPTANLPNFVLDGASPHNRPHKVTRKREPDWLTSLGLRKNEGSKTIDSLPTSQGKSSKNVNRLKSTSKLKKRNKVS